jgi:hypothetical protein
MALEEVEDPGELAEHRGHRFLHRRRSGAGCLAGGAGEILRGADAGDDVLALGVDADIRRNRPARRWRGSRVKATPVAEVSPILPNTIAWTLTAVPQSPGCC